MSARRPRPRGPWQGRGARRDEGAAVVMALLLAVVLVVLLLAAAAVTDLLAARQRAAAAADLAALAGAPVALTSPQSACSAASWVARANGGALRACEVSDGDLRVSVSARPRSTVSRWLAAVLGGLPEPTQSARAGMR
ncbi:MAG: helicase [Frankiales bacterium]|nr:helicase [Frankiales bacterium]